MNLANQERYWERQGEPKTASSENHEFKVNTIKNVEAN